LYNTGYIDNLLNLLLILKLRVITAKVGLVNITPLPKRIQEDIRESLRGGNLVRLVHGEKPTRLSLGRQPGQVRLVLKAFECLGIPNLISSEPCRQRDLVLAMIVGRLVRAKSKLSTPHGGR
jgi:hypothetical protein